MSNPFNPPEGPPPSKGAGSSTSNPFEAAEEAASQTQSQSQSQSSKGGFASPPGLPPNRPSQSSSSGVSGVTVQPDTMDVSIPDEPPPAYSSAPSQGGDQTVQAGPARMDFSGPPPIPDRFQNQIQTQPQNQGNYYHNQTQMEQQITGVGYGYRPEAGQPRLSAHYTGSSAGGFAPPPNAPPGKSDTYGDKPMSSQQTGSSMAGGAGPSRQAPPDLSPTEIATPGRPLLRKGQLLVYPKNHFCSKCTSKICTLFRSSFGSDKVPRLQNFQARIRGTRRTTRITPTMPIGGNTVNRTIQLCKLHTKVQ